MNEAIEVLQDNALDVAEQLVQSHDPDAFVELLSEFDIELRYDKMEDLLSRLHSVCTEEIQNWCKEQL